MEIKTLASIGDTVYYIHNEELFSNVVESIEVKIDPKPRIIYVFGVAYTKNENQIGVSIDDLFDKIRQRFEERKLINEKNNDNEKERKST
jgi:hypothetical protein